MFILGIVQSLFLCLLIASGSKKFELSQKILITWLLTISGILFFYLFSFSENEGLTDLLLILWAIEVVHGPLLYFYAKSVLDSGFRLSQAHGVHLIFYLLTTLVVFYNQYFTENTITVTNGYILFKNGAPFVLKISTWIFGLITQIYLGYALLLIHQKTKETVHFYADSDKVNLVWLKKFVAGCFVVYLFMYLSVFDFLGLYRLSDLQFAGISTSLFVLFAYYAAYVNYRHQSDLAIYSVVTAQSNSRFNEEEVFRIAYAPYRKSGLSPDKSNELLSKLLTYMETNKPYLNSRLTLRDLANDMELSTNHISQLINEKLGKNFFSFINEYRVSEFKQKISQRFHDSFTLTGVAMECGFSSKSAFYTVFKKITGMTPTEYIRKIEVDQEPALA